MYVAKNPFSREKACLSRHFQGCNDIDADFSRRLLRRVDRDSIFVAFTFRPRDGEMVPSANLAEQLSNDDRTRVCG